MKEIEEIQQMNMHSGGKPFEEDFFLDSLFPSLVIEVNLIESILMMDTVK